MGLFDRIFGRRSRGRALPRDNMEVHAPAVPPRPGDPFSVLERSLQAVRDSIRDQDQRLREVSKEDREMLETIEDKREFVRKQELDKMLCWLLREAWHYAAWSQRPDASEYVRLPLSDISGEEGSDGKVIRFAMGDLRYELRFRKWPSFAPSDTEISFADLSLTDEAGTPWLALRVRQDAKDEYDRWRPSSIEALRPGEWAVILTSMYVTTETARARDLMQSLTGVSRLDELRRAFDLPGGKSPA